MTNNYLLQAIGDNRWLCVDQLTGASVEWFDKLFNDTQQFGIKEIPDVVPPMDLPGVFARMANEMTQWLADNHRPKMEPMTPEGVCQWTREKVGRQVLALRQAAGLTHVQLAELCGLSRNHIYRVENGRYNFTIDTLARIASALGGNIEI